MSFHAGATLFHMAYYFCYFIINNGRGAEIGGLDIAELDNGEASNAGLEIDGLDIGGRVF